MNGFVKRHRGAILIVALGILAILAVIGATLISVSRVDHLAASNYRHTADLDLAAQALLEWVDYKLANMFWRTADPSLETDYLGPYDDANDPDCPIAIVRPGLNGEIIPTADPTQPGLYVASDTMVVGVSRQKVYGDTSYASRVVAGERCFNLWIGQPLPPPGTRDPSGRIILNGRRQTPDGGLLNSLPSNWSTMSASEQNTYLQRRPDAQRLHFLTGDGRVAEHSVTVIDLGGCFSLNHDGDNRLPGQSYDDEGFGVTEKAPNWELAAGDTSRVPMAVGEMDYWVSFLSTVSRWGPENTPAWPDQQLNLFDFGYASERNQPAPPGTRFYEDLPLGLEDMMELLHLHGTRFTSRLENCYPQTLSLTGEENPEDMEAARKVYCRARYATHTWVSTARRRIPQTFRLPPGMQLDRIEPPDLPAVKADLNSGPDDPAIGSAPGTDLEVLSHPLRRALMATGIWTSYPNEEVDQLMVNLMDQRDDDVRPRAIQRGGYTVCGIDCQPFITEVFIDVANKTPAGEGVEEYPVYVEVANPYDKELSTSNGSYLGRLRYGSSQQTLTLAAEYERIAPGGPIADGNPLPAGLTRLTGFVVKFTVTVPVGGKVNDYVFPVELHSRTTATPGNGAGIEVVIDRFPAPSGGTPDAGMSYQRLNVVGRDRSGADHVYFGGWDSRSEPASQTCVDVGGQASFRFNVAAPSPSDKIARPIENRSMMDMSTSELYKRRPAAELSFRRVGDIGRVLNIGPPRVTDPVSARTITEWLGTATEATYRNYYVDITKRAAGGSRTNRAYRRLLTVVTVNSPSFDGIDNDCDGTIDLTGRDGEDRGYHYMDSVTANRWWYDHMGPELYQFAPVNLKTAPPEVIRGILPAELQNPARGGAALNNQAMWQLACNICRFAQDRSNSNPVRVKSPADILDMPDQIGGRNVKTLFADDGVDDDNNGAPDDFAEQTWVYGYMSNWATTRSDCFAVYGTVRLRIPGGAVEGLRRFVAVLDRVPATAFRPFANRDVGSGTDHTPNRRYLNSRIVGFRWLD